MTATTADNRYADLHRAVSAIAVMCDGAVKQDGVGFDGTDTKFGRRVAAMPVETWDEAVAVEVSRILPKYRDQLAEYGIDLGEVELVKGEDRRHEARQVAREAERRSQNVPHVVLGDHHADFGTACVQVFNGIDVRQALKGAGFSFYGCSKTWEAPLNARTAQAVLALAEIELDAEQRDRLESLADVPAEPEYEVRVINGRVALVTEYGRLPLDTIRSLPGRKWDSGRKLNWVEPHSSLLDLGLSVSPEAQDMIDGNSEAEASERELIEASRAADSDADVALADVLYPYQRAGVAYALRAGRTLIADEMGLGKSITALSTLETKGTYPAVVVCPASLKLNWAREVGRWLPHRTVEVRSGKTPKSSGLSADITVLNYDILSGHVPALGSPAALVIDESHYAKEAKAQRTKAVRALAAKVPAGNPVLALTGTPVTNRPKELVQQLLLLGALTEEKGQENSTGKFLFRYCGPVNNGYGWTFNGATNTAELHDWLRKTCMVRREKSQVLTELPPKVRAPQFTELTPAAAREYAELEEQAALYASYSSAEQLVYLTKVREAVGLAKIDQAVDWAQNFLATGKSLVVFAHHKVVQAALIERLTDAGHDVTHILGSQPTASVEEHKARFQAGESKVLVASLTAAREGHTLTAASDVLFTELPWTPGAMAQAEDRAHRIGQNDSVTCWSLLAENTVDTDMYQLIEEKREVVRAVTDGTEETTQTAIASELFARLLAKHADKQIEIRHEPEMEA